MDIHALRAPLLYSFHEIKEDSDCWDKLSEELQEAITSALNSHNLNAFNGHFFFKRLPFSMINKNGQLKECYKQVIESELNYAYWPKIEDIWHTALDIQNDNESDLRWKNIRLQHEKNSILQCQRYMEPVVEELDKGGALKFANNRIKDIELFIEQNKTTMERNEFISDLIDAMDEDGLQSNINMKGKVFEFLQKLEGDPTYQITPEDKDLMQFKYFSQYKGQYIKEYREQKFQKALNELENNFQLEFCIFYKMIESPGHPQFQEFLKKSFHDYASKCINKPNYKVEINAPSDCFVLNEKKRS